MIVELAGGITAIILLTAGLIQLFKILKTKKAAGISSFAWFLYGIAGIGSYIFAEKYIAWQAIFSFLVPGVISLIISVLAYKYNKKRKR
jgi:uncharacterized protein with PQ loop repeat